MHHNLGDFGIGRVEVIVLIFAIGLFIRLASSRRLGLIALLAVTGGFLTYGTLHLRSEGPRGGRAAIRQASVVVMEEGPKAPPGIEPREEPPRPKRAPKKKHAPKPKAAPGGATGGDDHPAPPVAGDAPADDEMVAPETPLTLYIGTSKQGRTLDALPDWVAELADAKAGSNSVSFSSDRFASIEEAENQLWAKACRFVGQDLEQRNPAAAGWTPPADLLKSRGFLLERCVERTTIDVGSFVEPMYRVHWKGTLSKNVREAVVEAWRPTVQSERVRVTAVGFLGAAAVLAFLNFVLRLAPGRSKKPPSGN